MVEQEPQKFPRYDFRKRTALSPLLLVIVMDAPSESVRDGSLLELVIRIILFCVMNQISGRGNEEA